VTLFEELKRRRVFRAIVGYGIVAFALLQVVEPIMHGLHLPDETLTFVVVALGFGFPVVVVLAWAFDVSAAGVERTSAAPGASPRPPTRMARLRLALVLVGIGLLAAAPGLTWYFFAHRVRLIAESPRPTATSPSIAVLPFVDLSQAKDQEYFSDGIAEEILNVLAQVEGLHVAGRTSSFSFKGAKEAQEALDELRALADPPTYQVAQVFAWWGDRDRAFEQLERCRSMADVGLRYVKYDPLLRKVRGDPRYKALLEEIKLPLD